jgi:transposase InsO family protein
MNKEWFTAQELIDLPGLPTTPYGVRKKADNEGWKSQKRAQGKGLEYHLSSLPLEAKQALAKLEVAAIAGSDSPAAKAGRAMAQLAAPGPDLAARAQGMKQLITMAPHKRERAEVRALIVQARARFCAPYIEVRQLVKGEQAFVAAYNRRELELPAEVYDQVKTVSVASLRRWEKTLEGEGLAALAGRYKSSRQHLVDENPALADFLKALVTAKPHLVNKWSHLHRLLSVYVSKNGLPWAVPSQSSLRRWLTRWLDANQAAFAFATNPKKYNDKYRTAVERMYPWMKAPNDVWEFDSTPVDAMLTTGRHSIIAVIDAYTRRVRLLVAPTSSAEGICLLLRKTLLSWGTVNEGGLIRTDNGSDYVSKRTTAIYNLLGLEVSRANAFSGWEKPFIERFFRTLSHGLVELLPGYIGHNVADREVIEARMEFAKRLEEKRKPEHEKEGFDLRMTQGELQQLLDDWVDAYYHQQPHDGEGMNGKTPAEKYRESRYQPRAISDDGALDVLLNFAGEATVLKGFIKLGGLRYTAPELLENDWKGQRVQVFLDPADVGRAFVYRQGDMENRVEAVDASQLGREVSPAEYREKKKEDFKALRNFRRGMKDLAKAYGVDHLHQDVVEHFTEQAKKLAELPVGHRDHGVEAIRALGDVASRLKNPEENRYSEAQVQHLQMKRELLEQRQEEVQQQQGLLIRNEHDKARQLAQQSLERELTDRETAWLEDYKRRNVLGAKRIEEMMAGRKLG